ncbi:MAG: ParB family protein [Candidatus Accumulibacter sp.]|jgi:ParB family protein of integrating conjugative element (PFGI_1 class)|nr:ParB family protein [Accumulibacter sp.]
MADLTPQEMAGKLLAENFDRSGPLARGLSDPRCDTPIVVTLDELRPYELNPRLTRNPLYDEIKASIRERGLDAPPPITRRPGADHYIVRNGGNTRLAILRELWSETKDERFFRISCLFRPWPDRGEIVALTGHLAENELHGSLSFIERALGVEKARALYEQESGQPLSQSELARRLTADGYPVPQSHISRMQDTVCYLLPAIPNVLYGGLGRHQVERLVALRRAGERVWEQQARVKSLNVDFETLFQDVLARFDLLPADFSVPRVQDELIGQMAELLGVDYNLLDLDIGNIEQRQRVVMSPPQETANAGVPAMAPNPLKSVAGNRIMPAAPASEPPADPAEDATRLQEHIVSPVASTERLQAIQHLVTEHAGEVLPDFADTVLRAIPVQVGGLFPITDVWYIEPSLDTSERLRTHIAQFAREIAEEAHLADCIKPVDEGIGFVCTLPDSLPAFGRALLILLRETSQGSLLSGGSSARLSDNGLVKFFRLLRLARRLLDSEAGSDESGH